MIRFNSNHILAGYIKQLLQSVNLPTENRNGWTGTDNPAYAYNIKMQNCMRNFRETSVAYDSYTHECLGDFLRFYRDFTKIDLMPLYNCFSDRVCDNIKIDHFDSKDANYKIYMIPVKLGQQYTVAIDEATSIEMCCILSDRFNIESSLAQVTYQKVSGAKFLQPFVFDKLLDKETLADLVAGHEAAIKLLLKIPTRNKSSITILEGDFTAYNQQLFGKFGDDNKYTYLANHSVINFEYIDSGYDEFKLITSLQLLRANNGISYPFADRLVEYLTDNAITSEETIKDNILRVQEVLGHERINNKYLRFGLPGV